MPTYVLVEVKKLNLNIANKDLEAILTFRKKDSQKVVPKPQLIRKLLMTP